VDEWDRRVRLVVAHVQANTHGLVQHNSQRLEEKLALTERVLRCYLQPSGKYDVQRGAEVFFARKLGDFSRTCLQGTGAVQLDAQAVWKEHLGATANDNDQLDDNDQLIQRQYLDSTPTYIVAPHLWGHNVPGLAWFFSTPLLGGGWAISTYQFDRTNTGFSPAQRLRGFVQSAVYSSLHATELSACENSPCAMNNADGEHPPPVNIPALC
jgi:hypothetical protein